MASKPGREVVAELEALSVTVGESSMSELEVFFCRNE